VLLLDGGMGHHLKVMGVQIEGPVGSMQRFLGVAMANTHNPELVRDAHLSFIDAGCDVITTNSYSVVPSCLALNKDAGDGEGDDIGDAETIELRRLVQAAGRAAQQACDARPDRHVKIAGCLPPLNESYQPDRVSSLNENLQTYREIANSIAPFADVLLCETMSTAQEAVAAATAAAETGLPVWVAWTLDEQTHPPVLRSGESLFSALDALREANLLGKVDAFLFNCTSPEMITEAVPLLLAEKLLPQSALVGGYANGFETAASGCGEYRVISPEDYWEKFVCSWIESGRAAGQGNGLVVGGCCAIYPKHIARVRAGINSFAQ